MTKHYEMRYQDDYIAKLREYGDTCMEVVFFRGGEIHREEFPSSNLGDANRADYLACMVASIAHEHQRRIPAQATRAGSEIRQ